MSKWSDIFTAKYLNGGSVLLLMGVGWLYLWTFPWYKLYVSIPHWGHNYAEAIAFLVAGLAYFNRRLVSSTLAFLATLLVIPASLELLPHPVTALTGVALLILVIFDIFLEHKRERDLGEPANRVLAFWLRKHLPRFSYLLLAHIALVYFLVRLPSGTYETDLVTRIYDGMLFPFIVFILLEDMTGMANLVLARRLAFFWGMLTMIICLAILSPQPETWSVLALSLIMTTCAIVALVVSRKKA